MLQPLVKNPRNMTLKVHFEFKKYRFMVYPEKKKKIATFDFQVKIFWLTWKELWMKLCKQYQNYYCKFLRILKLLWRAQIYDIRFLPRDRIRIRFVRGGHENHFLWGCAHFLALPPKRGIHKLRSKILPIFDTFPPP